MEGRQELGPQVPEHEEVIRAILTAVHWSDAEDRPSSAAFDYDYFSAELMSRASPAETLARMTSKGKIVLRLVQFNCGKARQIDYDTRDERDDIDPSNLAHVHVYNIQFSTLGSKARKTHAKKLAALCIKVVC